MSGPVNALRPETQDKVQVRRSHDGERIELYVTRRGSALHRSQPVAVLDTIEARLLAHEILSEAEACDRGSGG